ncbi:MAG: MFS transporter [Caulobacteraceae bacterium]
MSQPIADPQESALAPFTAAGAGTPRLKLRFIGLYGLGDAVEVMINFALANFLLFYLTIVCGMSGALAGLSGLIAICADAFIDPLVGSWSDNLRSRLGRRHPFLLGAPIPAALALIALFSIPASLHGWGLFAYATGFSLLLRIGLSLFQVPYFAFGAEVTENYTERSTIVASRVAMGVIGTVIATLLSYRLFLAGPGGTTHRAGYLAFAIAFAAVLAVCGLVSGFGTLGHRARLHAAPAHSQRMGGLARFAAEIAEIFRNRSFRILFSGCLILFVGLGVATPLTLYAYSYFWRLTAKAMGDLTLIYTGGLAGGIVVMSWLASRLEKRTLALAGLMLIFAGQIAPVPLKLAGLIPSVSDGFIALCFALVCVGAGSSAALIGFQSMMGDAADEHDQLFGARREGLYFAGINLSAKASTGIGTLLSGLALDFIGFPHNSHAGAHVSAASVKALGLIYGPGASVLTFIAVVIMMGYGLSRARHAEIVQSLAASRPRNGA